MKITILISSLSGGGAERVCCNLANHLSDFGHEVEILTMGEAPAAEPLRDGIKYSPLLLDKERSNPLVNNVKRILRLRCYMKRQAVDAYVVMLPVTIELMLRFSNLTKAPIIASERADPKACTAKTQKTMRRLAPKAAGWVFQTEEVATWYAPYLKGVASRVIPNAINPAFIRPAYEGGREKVIIGAGRLAKQKNFPLLIRAFARIAPKFPEYKLVIYGKGDLLGSLKSLADELGVAESVEFPGYVPDMPERLARASMFVLSSDFEGMPNALMEAMASGLPCVSTDCGGGGARFLIDHERNGLLVAQKDEEAMAAAMERILSDEAFAASLGREARALQETLSPEKIYGEWERFIRRTVKEK